MFSIQISARRRRICPRNFPETALVIAAALSAFGCTAQPEPLRRNSPRLPSRTISAASSATLSASTHPAPPTDELHTALPTNLLELVEVALLNNPSVQAARFNYEASLERAPQVGGLPNPRLRGKYFLEEVQSRVGPQEWSIGVEQQFPAVGVLDAKVKAASAQAEARAARLKFAILQVSLEVKLAWHELYYLGQAIRSVREDRDRLSSLETVIRRDYASGSTPYTDLIRAQVELGRSENRLAGLEDQQRPAAARLNAALHRPSNSTVPIPEVLEEPGRLLSTLELSERLEISSPLLSSLRHEKHAAREAQKGAEYESRPAFSLGVEYIETGSAIAGGTAGSGDDPLALLFSVDLPIYGNRYSAARREARAKTRMVSSSLEATLDRLYSELESEHFIARDAERQIALYQTTLVPRARQAFEATETAFRSGQANFLELIDAERVLLEFHLSLQRARTDRALAHARLEALVGDSVTIPNTTAPATLPQQLEERPR